LTFGELEPVDPSLLERCAWETEHARRDLEVLAWVGRFRFVEPRAIGRRFGVSWQAANARVRRLERLGLLGTQRQHVSQARAVFLTAKGHQLLGGERRRAPRAEVQREHEAAIVDLVVALERSDHPGFVRVLTERECRGLEARGDVRYSVEVCYSGPRKDRRRWPDLVVELAEGRRAIEFEFAPKGRERLKRIVAGYASAVRYDEVVFFVKRLSLGRTISQLIVSESDTPWGYSGPEMLVRPWPGLPAAERQALADQLPTLPKPKRPAPPPATPPVAVARPPVVPKPPRSEPRVSSHDSEQYVAPAERRRPGRSWWR
jgi:hypothetical protein